MKRQLDHYRNIAAAFLQPDLDPAVRESRARELADAAVDLRRGVALAGAVLPGLIDARLQGADELRHALSQRREYSELRAVAYQALADTPGLQHAGLTTGLGGTGLGEGLPLIRVYATEGTTTGGKNPLVPGLVSGDTIGAIDPTLPLDHSDVGTIDDIGAEEEWHSSVFVTDVARQVRDWTTEEGRQILDQIVFDIVDRGAERYIATQLALAAGAPTPAGDDLAAALDNAESGASAALQAPAGMVICAPDDWSHVRRAVAQSWQQEPAPTPVVSMGLVPGTVLVTGRPAFHLFRLDYTVDHADRPRSFDLTTGVSRPFYLAIRNPEAIRAVTLPEA